MNRRELLKVLSYSTSALLVSCAMKSRDVRDVNGKSVAAPDRPPGKLYFFRVDYGNSNPYLETFGLHPNLKADQRTRRWLCEFDLARGTAREVEITGVEVPHSILIDQNRNRLVCIPKIGTTISVVQLDSFKEMAHFSSRPGFYFYGHGGLSPDGALLYVTQAAASSEGYITVHDAESYRDLRVVESFGSSPHDLRVLKADVLIVANNSRSELNLNHKVPSTLVWVDPSGKKSKLIKKIDMATSELTVQHFAIEKGNDPETRILLGLDAPWPGDKLPEGVGLIATYDSGGLHMMKGDSAGIERMHRNTLSVDGDSILNVVLTTTPESHLSLWDSREKKLLKEFESIRNPHGLNAFVVSPENRHVDYFVTTAATGIYKVSLRRSAADQPLTHEITLVAGTEGYRNILGHSTLAPS